MREVVAVIERDMERERDLDGEIERYIERGIVGDIDSDK